MRFNNHYELKDKHAFLSPSKYHWINYDIQKLREVYINSLAVERGTKLHEIAANLIKYNLKLPRKKATLNLYVNDGIGFRLSPEVALKYSDICFGTADTIGFDDVDKVLRISDLKTGVSIASMHQLEIYAALFCLEYSFDPKDISIELRIYQNDEVELNEPEADAIQHIMNVIIDSDKELQKLKSEVDV